MTMTGAATGIVEVDLFGQPLSGGGVLLDTSSVRLGPASQPSLYTGEVAALRGEVIDARVTSSGRASLGLVLNVQTEGSRVAGTLQAQSAGSSDEGGGQ